MIYLILALTGLLVIVALLTYINRHRNNQTEEIVAPPTECCGAHAICEKGLKKADAHIDYFDDEELDSFQGIPADGYNDQQIDIFRDILYTLRHEEVEDWLISLEKRNINLPEILRPEALEML